MLHQPIGSIERHSWRGYCLAAGATYELLTSMSDQFFIIVLAETTEIHLGTLDNHMYIDSAAIGTLKLIYLPAHRSPLRVVTCHSLARSIRPC